MKTTYCFSDVHGQYDLWTQFRDFADETDTLIFLGDAIDRGPDGIKILQEMIADKRVIMLLGNHEDFLARYQHDGLTAALWMSKSNGGKPTYEKMQALPLEERQELIKTIRNLPRTINYVNSKGERFLLSHAGFTPDDFWEPDPEDLLWSRDHFNDPWPPLEEYKNTYIIHGHTPAPFVSNMRREMASFDIDGDPNIYIYENGHKICLDLASPDTKKIALYNLDERKLERYFYGEKETDSCRSTE